MAESIREEEGKVQCPLCPRVYKSGKVCKDHLYEKHQGHPNLAELVRSVANDKCPYCGQPKANLVRHKPTCRARPPPEAQEDRAVEQPPHQVVEQQGLGQEMQELRQQMGQEMQGLRQEIQELRQQMQQTLQVLQQQQQQRHRQPHKYEGATNKEMVELFKKRMRERQNNSENTVQMYSTVLEDFFKLEETWDPEFKAFRWWDFWREEGYVPIRAVSDYTDAMGRGCETNKRIHTVYKHLHKWIDEALTEATTDPHNLHRQRLSGLAEDRAANKRAGTIHPGQGRKEAADEVERHLDPSVVRGVHRVAQENQLHEETLVKFAASEWTHVGCDARKDCRDCRCRLQIKTLQDAQNFLAMSVFIRNFGLRLQVVMNMTVGGLQEAEDALVVCPYCEQKVPKYSKHKKMCHR